jgi:hypothetical protein
MAIESCGLELRHFEPRRHVAVPFSKSFCVGSLSGASPCLQRSAGHLFIILSKKGLLSA